MRKAIDSATRTGGYVDYREAEGWAANVDEVLATVAELASGGRAGLALELVVRAIDRIEGAAEEIDDSDGHCSALLDRAAEIHLAATRVVRPEPVALARDLFARETQSDWETFAGAAALYADVLGEEGLAEYRRLANEAWEKLPARAGKALQSDEFVGGYHELKGILDFFAERDGDVEARIALRAKDLSSPWSYLELADFCLAQGREEEALRRAEEGLWVFEDGRPDERLVLFAVGLLAKAGRSADAEAHLWRAFEKAPSLELYGRLRKLGGEAARARATTFLEARLVNETRTAMGPSRRSSHRYPDAREGFRRGLGGRPHARASIGVKEALARASEATHPREALEVYAERVEQLASSGGNPAYAEAAKLIAHGGPAQRGRAGGICRGAQGSATGASAIS